MFEAPIIRRAPSRTARWAVTIVSAVALAGVLAPAASAVVPAPLVGWGQNTNGQLGLPTAPGIGVPTAIPEIDGVTAVGVGASHSLALRQGEAYGAGNNGNGQIGRFSATLHPDFGLVLGGLTTVRDVAAGRFHSLLLLEDGTVRAIGQNAAGQLGLGHSSPVASNPPSTVTGLTDAVAVAAGWEHSVALLADGTVRAWGANANNEVGDGSGTARTSPVAVPGVSDVVAISTGEHTLALRRDGQVYAWGKNTTGQLGQGDTAANVAPALVPGITNAVAVSAGREHSLVLLADGTVRAFGNNNSGRLGDGTIVNRSSPVRVVGLEGIVEISAQLAGGSARQADGTVWVWGNGAQGQLADGVTTSPHSSPVPLRVAGVRAQALSQGSAGASFHLAILHVPVEADGPLRFTTQARETLSAPQAVTLTIGTGQITRLRTIGPEADDFLISGDDCVGEQLGAGDTCTVRVRFSPSATGARSAQLRVSSTTAADVLVDLSGAGGELVEGPAGRPGDQGVAGPVGLVGPVGPGGPVATPERTTTTDGRATVACRWIAQRTRIRCTVRATTKRRVRATGRISGIRKSTTRSGSSRVTLTLAGPRRNPRPQVAVTVRAGGGHRATIKVRVGSSRTASLRLGVGRR